MTLCNTGCLGNSKTLRYFIHISLSEYGPDDHLEMTIGHSVQLVIITPLHRTGLDKLHSKLALYLLSSFFSKQIICSIKGLFSHVSAHDWHFVMLFTNKKEGMLLLI